MSLAEAKQPKDATAATTSNNIYLEPIAVHHLRAIADLIAEAFGSKRTFSIFPNHDSYRTVCKKYKKFPPEKLALGAVAVDASDDQVVGFIQMNARGLPDYFPDMRHVCKPDEVYIEMIAVSSRARGQGVGTKLLEWSVKTAKEQRQARTLSLFVVRGNRAVGLYERFGFEIVNENAMDQCCNAAVTFCLLGRPYGLCNPEWGCYGMIKKI